MRLAMEKWQERMRYAADTGTMPPGRRSLRWRLPAACLGIALAGAAYLARSPSQRPWVDPDSQPKAVALASAEPVRKRSYTPSPGTDTPAAAVLAPQPDTTPPRAQAALAEPATTGAMSPAPSDEAGRARTAGPDKPAKRPRLREARLAPEPRAPEPRTVRRQAEPRDPADGKREIERTAPPAGTRPPRRQPPSLAAHPRYERAVAVAPARVVSVCLYFVVCF